MALDRDGREDLLLVTGGPLSPEPGGTRLYRNTRKGLKDVTRKMGIRAFGEADAELVDLNTLSGNAVIFLRLRSTGRLRKDLHLPVVRERTGGHRAAGQRGKGGRQSAAIRLVAAGAEHGLRHAGLRALSSLRMEKAYRDYGHDIDNTDSVLEAGLGFAADRSVSQTIPTSASSPTEIEIDMSSNALWRGTIRSLRVDFSAADTGTSRIEYMRFSE